MRKKKKNAAEEIGREQKRLLSNLRLEVKQTQDLLKLLTASQDSEAVRRDQIEFLGIVGSRILNPHEQELAKQGISIDELRKICGRNIEANQRNNSLRDSLPPDHVLRIVYAEHDLLLYFLYDLSNLGLGLYKMPDWAAAAKYTEKIDHITGHLCAMDVHQVREERIILPQLVACSFADMPKLIFGEHKRLHKQRAEIKELVDIIGKMDFEQWRNNFDQAVRSFVPAVREHTYKEEHILYPAAIAAIPDSQVWENMKIDCDNIDLYCF